MTDDLPHSILERILAEEPPAKTVPVRLFRNSPAPVPCTVRLLTEAEDMAVRAAVGALPTVEEKEAAWIREPLIHGAWVSLDGQPLPADLAERRTLVTHLHKPIIAALYQAYQDLDSEELAASLAVADAPFHPGADSGPPSRASGQPAGDASPGPPSPPAA